tara:strand:+ start:77640 stop:77843 length:204 start_codon:yes stop_codon:yes gene_type:complete
MSGARGGKYDRHTACLANPEGERGDYGDAVALGADSIVAILFGTIVRPCYGDLRGIGSARIGAVEPV